MIDHELHATWRARLEDHRVSGLSIAAWCRKKGIPDHQFYYWKKKFAPKDGDEKTPTAVEWAPVVVADEPEPTEPTQDYGITIHVGHAFIAVRPGFNEALLTDIIKVLQSC